MGAASILTTLFDNEETEGAKSFDSATVASGRAISFSTVLTNAYFAGDADTLTCAGSVDVETLSTISVASGQELCDTYLSDMIEQGVDMSAYLALHYIETYQVCCWSTSVDVCDAAWETYNCDPLGDLWVQMVYPGVCSVAESGCFLLPSSYGRGDRCCCCGCDGGLWCDHQVIVVVIVIVHRVGSVPAVGYYHPCQCAHCGVGLFHLTKKKTGARLEAVHFVMFLDQNSSNSKVFYTSTIIK